MRTDAAILVGVMMVLGGCVGGAGWTGEDATATDDATLADSTTAVDETATSGAATESAATATGDTTGESTTAATTDCGRTTESGTSATTGDRTATETPAGTETTTLPATTDVERNVTATFVIPNCEDATVTLRVADESEERQRGLMYRQSLSDRSGMVFVYDDPAPRTFWMKNTYVPLDIIFVAENGTVLNVAHAQAQPNAPDSEVDRYSSDGEAKYVVELERGFANRTGVGPGTELVFNDTAPEAGPGTPETEG